MHIYCSIDLTGGFFFLQIVGLCLQYITYDPNYNYDEEDDEDSGMEVEEDDEDA